MTVLEPLSTAKLPAVCLIAVLATTAHAQVLSAERHAAGDVSLAADSEARSSAAVHHYGIIGQVSRPGVYVCVHDDLTLAELVRAAGGTTPLAGGSAQVVRRGHAGPKLNATPPSTAALVPGDVVVVEQTAAAGEHSPEWIDVALVGLAENVPVVLQVRPALTELPQLIAALHQEPVLIRSVRIQRTSQRPSLAAAEPTAERLSTGDVVVFETAKIDQAALAQAEEFPPPVLIPQREARADLPMVIQPRGRGADAGISEAGAAAQADDVAAASEPATGEALPVAAVTPDDSAAPTDELPEEVWPLMHEPAAVIASAMVPPLELPRTVSLPLSTESNHSVSDEPDTAAASDREPQESDVDEAAVEPQPVVAASLIDAAGRPTSPRTSSHSAAGVEPQRMAELTGEAITRRATAGSADRIGIASQAKIAKEAQQAVPVAVRPRRAPAARSFGMRAVSVGIFVLATAVFCFVASLLWSRLDDSTGLPRPIAKSADVSAGIGSLSAHRTALDRLINNALPIIEEPTPLPEGATYHGESVGRRRLRIDAEQTLTGPHFGASQQISHPGAVPVSAGTATSRSEREDFPTVPTEGQAEAPPQRANAQGGLLDRVLVAMEREKRR